MSKHKAEMTALPLSKAEAFAQKCQDRMRQRIAESNRLALEYEQKLDPRQRTSEEVAMQ